MEALNAMQSIVAIAGFTYKKRTSSRNSLSERLLPKRNQFDRFTYRETRKKL